MATSRSSSTSPSTSGSKAASPVCQSVSAADRVVSIRRCLRRPGGADNSALTRQRIARGRTGHCIHRPAPSRWSSRVRIAPRPDRCCTLRARPGRRRSSRQRPPRRSRGRHPQRRPRPLASRRSSTPPTRRATARRTAPGARCGSPCATGRSVRRLLPDQQHAECRATCSSSSPTAATFTDTEAADTRHRIRLLDRRSLTYRQINTAKSGDYRIVKTYVSDPTPRDGARPHPVRLPDRQAVPGLRRPPAGARQRRRRRDRAARRARPGRCRAAIGRRTRRRPSLGPSTNEFHGAEGGLAQLESDHKLTRHRAVAADGAVEQTATTRLTGVGSHQTMTLALWPSPARKAAAKRPATAHCEAASRPSAREYRRGWHRYLDSLRRPPRRSLTTRARADRRTTCR